MIGIVLSALAVLFNLIALVFVVRAYRQSCRDYEAASLRVVETRAFVARMREARREPNA